MSPRTFVSRTAALLALAALGAACETKTVVQPPPPPVIGVTVSPQSATLTTAGQTVTFVALVTGGDNTTARTVTWSSSNTAVATVDANGVVTAKANGTSSIIAASTADPTARGAGLVTVNIPPVVHTDTAPATVSIASITTDGITAADINNIVGSVYITLNVDVPAGRAVSSVNWLIDGKTVCSQTFTQGKSSTGDVTTKAADAVQMTCQINSLKTDSVTGKPVFANGSHTFTATLVGPSGTTQASTTQTLVFNNPNAINVATSTTKTAIGPGGIIWNGGNLTLTASPVIYAGNAVARVNFTLISKTTGVPIAGGLVVDSTAADGFSATFRGDTAGSPLNNLTDSVYVQLSSVTTAGTQGPSVNATKVFWFDNQAPAAVLYYLNKNGKLPFNWTNASFAFSSAIDTTKDNTNAARAGAVDAGVDRVTYTFYAGPAYDTMSVVTTGNDLAETTVNNRYLTKVVITDALGNTRTVYGNVSTAGDTTAATARFGIDKQAPVVLFDVSNTVADTSKYNITTTAAGVNYVIGFQDLGASGFATATPVNVVELADTGTSAICVVGSTTTTNCDTPAAYNSAVPVDGAGTQEGYVTMNAYVVDRALNKSNVLTRRVLVDYHNAVVDSATVTTAPLAGGAAETFRMFMHDTLNLAAASAVTQYSGVLVPITGGGTTPFLKPLGSVALGSFGTFTKAPVGDFSDPFFIRAAAVAVANASPGLASYLNPASVNVKMTDDAGNIVTSPQAGVFTGLAAITTDPFAAPAGGTLTVTASADSSNNAMIASLTVTGTAATVSPAAQVLFYQYDPATATSAGTQTLVGTGTNPVITVNGTQATFTWTVTPTATLKPTTRDLVAAFVSSGGVGLFYPVPAASFTR